MKDKKGIFSAIELAGYIMYKYSIMENRISDDISPLKLQISLYNKQLSLKGKSS